MTENRYHDMVEGLPAIVAVLDMNADEALFVNPQVERITGMPPAHWTRPGGLAEFRSRVHPDDYPQQGGLPRVGVRTRSAEFRWIRPDGRTRWLRSVSAMLPGTEGLVQALAFDVTAEMRAAEGLAQQRHRYQTLVEQLPVATFVTDAEGVLTYISPQIEPILGVTPEQLIGMSAEARQEFVVEDDRPLMERAGGRLYRGETDRYDIQLRMRNADGRTRHVHMIARDLRDGEGVRLALQGVIVDVTDQRMAEQRRREALEALVTAAEAEQTRISAELHDDTVQVMTAMLMQIRRLGGDDPRVAELETMLAGALDRTRRLMFELRPQVLQREGLAAAIEELAAEGPWSSHTVEIEVPRQSDTHGSARLPHDPRADHQRSQALAGIGAAGVRRGAGGELVFDVRDDGVGFDLDRALDRDLMRLHLGLDTSAERVRVAGGELRMQSEPGQGARFQLRLPVAPAETG